MSDAAGIGIDALLTAAAHPHVQGSARGRAGELKRVRLRMRQAAEEPQPPPPRPPVLAPTALRTRSPSPIDLQCRETLLPEPSAPSPLPVHPLAATVVSVPWQPPPKLFASGTVPAYKFDDESVDNLYWEKHMVLCRMMGGFANTLADQLHKCERKPGLVHDRAELLHAIVKEKRVRGRKAKFKTITDHQCIDDLIHIVCKMHTKVVHHASQGRFRSQQTQALAAAQGQANGAPGGSIAR